MTASIIGVVIIACMIAAIIYMARVEYKHGATDEKAKNLEAIVKKHAEAVERQKETDRICRPWPKRAREWMRGRSKPDSLRYP